MITGGNSMLLALGGFYGGASVLGGILCIIIAMSAGFSVVLIFSWALYLAALPCLVLLRKSVD